MKPERRRSSRKKLDKLAYIDMEPENGGIVLDVSEGGLGFQAVAPVEQARPIHFWFWLEAGHRMEATGELAWTDETRKGGGLRFTHVLEEGREQIRSWIVQSNMPITSGRDFAPSLAAPNECPGSRAGNQCEDVVGAFNAPHRHDAASSQTSASTVVPSLLGLTSPEPEPMWDPIPTNQSGSVSRPQFIRGVITGILITLFLTTVALFHTHRREVGNLLMRFGERIAPETKRQTLSPAPRAIPTSNPSPEEAASADKTKTGAASAQSALNPMAPSPMGRGLRSSQSANTGHSELTVAQQYLRGTIGRRDTAAGARWLWAAVGKGNVTAEMLLADLYSRGDGVRKSCDQARVLLIAASRRGNVKAMAKLRELNRNGCP